MEVFTSAGHECESERVVQDGKLAGQIATDSTKFKLLLLFISVVVHSATSSHSHLVVDQEQITVELVLLASNLL